MTPRHTRGRVTLLVMSLFAAGCSGASKESTAPTTSADTVVVVEDSVPSGETAPADSAERADPPRGLSETEAHELLIGFDTADQVSFSVLAQDRSDPGLLAAARRSLDAGATGDERWAATYVWVNEGDDAAPLIGLLAADDAAIRVMAATGLLARGREDGFEPLFALIVDDSLRPGHPPSQVWRDAAVALARYTAISELGPPLDASPAQRQLARTKWQAWFGEHRNALNFDAEVALWLAG